MIDCGFAFIPHREAKDTLRVLRAGEDLGFESGWLPDQTFYSDPFVLLASAAVATQRLGLGLGVTNPYTRHPTVTARAAATLDELAEGRFILAFGAGNLPELLAPLGIARTEAAARCREAVAVTKKLLAGETVQHRSATLVVDGVRLTAPARPRVRVYLAARSPGTMRAAGEVADGAILGGLFSDQRLRAGKEQVFAGARAAGRSPAEVDIVLWGSAYLTDFPPSDLETFKTELGRVIGRAGETTLRSGGWSAARIAELQSIHKSGGAAAVGRSLTDEEVTASSLFGDTASCRATLERLGNSGVRRFVLLMREATADRQIELLRQFARGVLGTA